MIGSILRWSGPIAAALFIVTIVAVGIATPNYDMSSQFVSELAAIDAPYANYMNFLGVIPFGVGMMLFAIGFLTRANFGHFTLLGALLLAISGAGFIAAGFYQCDTGCPFEGSRSQVIHNWTAFGAFVVAWAAVIWIGVSALWSAKRVAPFIVSVVAAIGMGVSFRLMGAGGLDHPMIGLYQRGFILSLCLWLIVLGLYAAATTSKR